MDTLLSDGCATGNDLVEIPNQQWALEASRRMRRGGRSLRRIGEWLTAEGFHPPQGVGSWRKQTVLQILQSRMVTELFDSVTLTSAQ